MIISRKKCICFTITMLAMIFRYLAMWDLISPSQRYFILIIVLLMLGIYLHGKKINKNKIVAIFIILIIGIIDFVISNEIDIFMSLLLAFIYLYDDGDKDFLKHFILASSTLYIVTILLCSYGIINNVEFVRVVGDKQIIRNTLGFPNPNHALTLLTAIIISLGLSINLKKYIVLFCIFALTTSCLIFYQTNSRTGFYLILLFLILVIFRKFIKIKKKNIYKYTFLYLTIISFFIAIFFENNVILNDILTNRPSLWANHINNLPISLFGFANAKVDNNYLWLIYRHGIIVYLFYFYIYVKSFKYFSKDKLLFISYMMILIYSMFENTLNYAMNPIFVICLLYVLNKDSYKMLYSKSREGDIIE